MRDFDPDGCTQAQGPASQIAKNAVSCDRMFRSLFGKVWTAELVKHALGVDAKVVAEAIAMQFDLHAGEVMEVWCAGYADDATREYIRHEADATRKRLRRYRDNAEHLAKRAETSSETVMSRVKRLADIVAGLADTMETLLEKETPE